MKAHHKADTMTNASLSPISSASNPPTPEESRPKKYTLRRWFKAFKHHAFLKTLRTESPSRSPATTVRSSMEVSDLTSTPPSSLTPITTTSSSSGTHKDGITRAEAHDAKMGAGEFVQHLGSNDKASSSPVTQAVPTILVTTAIPSPNYALSPTTISPSATPSNNMLSPTRSSTPATASPASAVAKPPRPRPRHRQPTMLTPELMREIEKANKKHPEIVMRDEEKRIMRNMFSEPVLSPRATMVRANPLRWGQD